MGKTAGTPFHPGRRAGASGRRAQETEVRGQRLTDLGPPAQTFPSARLLPSLLPGPKEPAPEAVPPGPVPEFLKGGTGSHCKKLRNITFSFFFSFH